MGQRAGGGEALGGLWCGGAQPHCRGHKPVSHWAGLGVHVRNSGALLQRASSLWRVLRRRPEYPLLLAARPWPTLPPPANAPPLSAPPSLVFPAGTAWTGATAKAWRSCCTSWGSWRGCAGSGCCVSAAAGTRLLPPAQRHPALSAARNSHHAPTSPSSPRLPLPTADCYPSYFSEDLIDEIANNPKVGAPDAPTGRV